MRIWNQWFSRQNCLLLTLFLRLMSKWKESCCVTKFEEFLNKRNWPELWSNADFSKNIEKVQFFITLDDDTMNMTRVFFCFEVRRRPMWRSVIIKDVTALFRGRTVSWVRIVNGINKHLAETADSILAARVGNPGSGWGESTIDTDFNVVSCVCSVSWT